MSRIITIASAKGGVGKSTIALNIAAAMTKMGHDAVAVDANIHSPTLATHLGMPQPERHIHGHIAGAYPIEQTIYRHQDSHVKIIPGSLKLQDGLDANAANMTKMASGLRTYFTYAIIDSAAGLHDESTAALTLGDEVIVIATPDMPGIIAARRTVELAKKLGKPASIIVNHINTRNDIQIESISGLVRAPMLGSIPYDTMVPYSHTINQPIIHCKPDSDAGREMINIARKIMKN